MLITASFIFTACDQPANNANSANKTANAATNANSATATNSATTDADVKKLLNDVAAALAKNDADAVSKFYADDYHLVTPQGVDQTKAERLADMKSGATKFDSFAYDDINVRSYGDTAIAISHVKATGTVSGQPNIRDMRATLVLRKMPDGWKVVSGQATPIMDAAKTATTANTATVGNKAANANKPANTNKPAPANK